LLRFAHKTSKNRLKGDFLPCKLPKQPMNRGFYGFFQRKNRKNLQVRQAPSMGISGSGPAAGPFPGGRPAESPLPAGGPGGDVPVPAARDAAAPGAPSFSSVPLTSFIKALKLPPGPWSASILSFAKFFSLPLEGNFFNLIRQKVLAAENLSGPASGKGAEGAAGTEEGAEFREALSLAALAARAKGVELSPEALTEYARALLRGRRADRPAEGEAAPEDRNPDQKPGTGLPRGAEAKDRENRREADTKGRGAGDRGGGGQEAGKESAGSIPALRERILGTRAIPGLLNRLPEQGGKRWIVLPFSMDGLFECCLRILLVPQAGSAAYRAERLGLDIRRREEPGPAWTFIFRTDTLESAGNPSLEVFCRPAPGRAEALEQELAALLDLPPGSVRVRNEQRPLFAEDSRDWILPSINKEV
jgi:hypothetical protein